MLAPCSGQRYNDRLLDGRRVAEVDRELAAALQGRYEIERELGHGGMAVVYLARDVRHDRLVAIKVLPPELATALGAERFLREISIAARLTHPNILALHESIADGRVLGYVMPYVDGESLAERLRRERQLPIDEAVAIARQVAAALDYSHAHGVVHRDVKPENIMLVGEQALLADFGLARAIQTASTAPLTGSGIAVGTPSYMSPEQATADHDVDGRTDIYALGCVLYEMIVGKPPFSGATAQAVIAQHVTRPPPSLCAERESCPEPLDAAVRHAMAKVPADRFRTAGEFSRAMAATVPTPAAMPAFVRPPAAARGHRRWIIAGCVIAGAATLVGIAAVRHNAGATDDADLVNAPPRIAVLPFGGDNTAAHSSGIGASVAERLSDALAEWQGVTVVDSRRVAEQGRGRTPPDVGDAIAEARSLGATRVVLGDVVGGTATDPVVRATLYDAATDSTLRVREAVVRDAAGAHAFRALANALLRDGDELPWNGADDHRAPPSLPAWRAYDDGRAALDRWDIAAATARFRQALALEPDLVPAQLWLAQAQAWLEPDRPDLWRDLASRALGAIDRLAPDDTLVARGVYALASGAFPDACAAYAALHARAPKDPVAWFGLGQCRMLDDAVLRDARSPSGWRFRSSYHAAALAYDSAIHRAVGTPAFAFRALAEALYTQPSRVRRGRALPPDGTIFGAYPTLAADTLALIPYTAADIGSGALRADRSTRGAALRRNANRLASALEEWVRRDSASADARAMLANVQEVRGDRASQGGDLAAMATLLDARRLSRDTTQRAALTIGIVRLLVKEERYRDARALADSLLAALPDPSPSIADTMASLASLTGRADRTARLLVAAALSPTAADRDPRIPDALASLGATYLAYAALGACGDTLRNVEQTVERALQQYVSADQRDHVRQQTLARPIVLAIQCLGTGPVTRLGSTSERLTRIQQAYGAGLSAQVRAQLDTLDRLREGIRPGDVTLDRTYQEAWLLAAIGDSAAAARRLDMTLTAPTTLGLTLVGEAVQAAALGRAMALRADLAAAAGDAATARRWAANVVALWSGASPELQPTVARMQGLAR